MLCIIAGHFGIASANRFVYTFHVPLFFLLSGYFLSTKTDFLPFMKQKARQLLIPYYITGIVILAVATIVNHFVWPEINAMQNAKSILGALLYGAGTPHTDPFAIRQIGLLWFLWALFFSTAFTRLALRTRHPLIIVSFIAVVGWASAKAVWLPLSIQSGAMASFFMYLGFLARKHNLLDKRPPLALVAALTLFWIASMHFGVSINIVSGFLSHGLLSVAVSIAASYLIVLACKVAEQRLRTVSRFLNFFGQTTLIVMCFHAISDFCFPNLMLYTWLEPCGFPHTLVSIIILTLNVIWPLLGVLASLRVPLLRKLFSVRPISPLPESKPAVWKTSTGEIPASELANTSSKKAIIAACALALLFALSCAVGSYCVSRHPLEGLRDYAVFFCIAAVFLALFLALFFFLKNAGLHILFVVQDAFLRFARRIAPQKLQSFACSHEFVMLSIAIVVAWLPYLVLFFPGVVMYDTTWELFQTQGSGALTMGREELEGTITTAAFTDHKPLFHTLLIGALFNLGKMTGSQTLGIFLITLFQYLTMAFACAFLLKYCHRVTGMRGVQIVGLVFLALFPVFPLYAVAPFNDCLAAAAFVVWAVHFAEATRTRADCLSSKKELFALIAWGAAAALLKKPNAYIIVACAIILAIWARKHIVAIAVQGLVPAVICLIVVPACVYPVLNVAPGDKGEMLGTFFQQTVTYALNNGDKLSDSDREAIDKIINLNKAISSYAPNTFDYAKYYYRNSETASELFDYFKKWAKEGADDPLCYLSAFAKIQYPWIYPSSTMDFYSIAYDNMRKSVATLNADYTQGKSLEVWRTLDYEAPSLFEGARDALITSLNTFEKAPGVGLILSVALYATWIPLTLTLIGMTSRKRKISLAALAPMYASMAVLFISPLVMCRYALPVFALTPLAFAIALSETKQGEIPRELNAQCAKSDS